jgi:hypothetical protein
MFMGLDDDGNMAWRATKPGYDALTETDQEKFSFSSDWLRSGLIHEVGTTDGSAYVFFDALPFRPHVLPFRLDSSTLYAGEQTSEDYTPTVSGPATAYFPIDIRTDRFLMAYTNHCPTPHVFPYIVFKVPIVGA